MKKYQYQLIQYIHDHFTKEFVNVGIIVYAPEWQFLKCKIVKRHTRIKALFPQVDGRFVDKVLKSLDTNIKLKSGELGTLFSSSDQLEKITSNILAKDNSGIQLNPVKYGLDVDLDVALNDLFNELVEKYMPPVSRKKSLTDNDVWQKKYKEYFEELNIADRLGVFALKTTNDTFEFDKAWKNDIWHCYQPVSFDLIEKEAIKDKVYRWFGRLNELQSAEEELHLTFLTSTSKNHKDLEEFIKEYLTFNHKGLKTEIVKESEAKKVAKHVKEMMEAHDAA